MQDESVTQVDDDGTVIASGQAAIQEMLCRGLAMQQQRRRVLAKLMPVELHRLERRLASGCAHVASRPRVRAAVVVPRRTNGPSGRPRSSASRSSARSGDSGNDAGSEPDADPAPPAAREAVAACWERILRERTPGVAWTARS